MRALKTVGIALVVLVVLAFANGFVRGFIDGPAATPAPTPAMTVAQLQAAAVTVPYDDLARSTEQHTGKYLDMGGKVVQVIEDAGSSSGGAGLRVLVDGDIDQAVYVQYPGYDKQRVLVNDMVQMVARVDGRVTYKTVLGSEVTVPALTALWVQVE